jgi:hypothetical protein
MLEITMLFIFMNFFINKNIMDGKSINIINKCLYIFVVVSTNSPRVPADGSISLHNRETESSWSSGSYAEASTSTNNDYAMGSGARPKDSSYTLSDPRIFNGVTISKASSCPVLSPSDDSDNTGQGDTLFGQGRAGVNNTM